MTFATDRFLLVTLCFSVVLLQDANTWFIGIVTKSLAVYYLKDEDEFRCECSKREFYKSRLHCLPFNFQDQV